jgi:hypothetical protein
MKDYKSFKLKVLAMGIDFVGSAFFFWIKKKEMCPDSVKKILIIKLDRIGDTFLTTPTIGGAERGRPPSEKVSLIEGKDPKHHLSLSEYGSHSSY